MEEIELSKLPSMPFFVDAYLGDTQHLTTEEHGVYCLLLMNLWRHECFLADDDRILARMTRLSTRRWLSVKPIMAQFLTLKDGKISQKRLRKEWERCIGKSTANSLNGTLGGKAKARKYNNLPLANAGHPPDIRHSKSPSENVAYGVAYQNPERKLSTSQDGDSEETAPAPATLTGAQAPNEEGVSHLLDTPLMRRTSR